MLAGGRGELLAGGTGNRFSQVEQGVILALAEVLRLEEFGQADDLGAASGGVGYAFESFLQILFWFGAAGHLHQGHAKFVRGHSFSPLRNNIASETRASGVGYRAAARPLSKTALLFLEAALAEYREECEARVVNVPRDARDHRF